MQGGHGVVLCCEGSPGLGGRDYMRHCSVFSDIFPRRRLSTLALGYYLRRIHSLFSRDGLYAFEQ